MNAPAVSHRPAGASQAIIDRVKRNLVGLKMPRALEILDVTLRGLECGETTALEAMDILLAKELTLRENRRVKTALQMARVSAIKTLAGFDFAFQASLDKNRIMALAELQFIDRAEAVHADLVVTASHNPGFAEHLFASNSGYLAAHAPVSVLVVRS